MMRPIRQNPEEILEFDKNAEDATQSAELVQESQMAY